MFEVIMNKSALMKLVPLFVLLVLCAFARSQASSPNSPPTGSAIRRVQVDADTASALVLEKTPISYPDAARNAGIQGTVVLKVVTTYSGDVQEVTVVSGDPALAQATAETVKKWKYKPYLLEGSPAEMETQVSITFHMKARTQPPPAPLGSFRENAYSNDYFNIYYPLSRDWVRETRAGACPTSLRRQGTRHVRLVGGHSHPTRHGSFESGLLLHGSCFG